MTDEGAEAPIGPVLGGPRRTGERARIAAVGVLAVLVFGMGIGITGKGAGDEVPPSAPATIVAAATTATPGPTATSEPTRVPPTQNVGLGCAPVRLGSPPELRVSSDAGNISPVTGLPPGQGPGSDPVAAAWPLPGADRSARLLAGAGLLLAPDEDACVRYVVAEYRPADPSLIGPFPIAFRTLNVSPPRTVVPLGQLPAGDWIVRIVAYFSTGVAGQENATVAERFFRVISGRADSPLPTPGTPPAVPCTPLPAGAPPPDLVLYGADGGPIVGIAPGTGQPEVGYAQGGTPIEIRDAGDACARSWSINAHDVDTGQTLDIETQENPTSDPFQFAQNRWRLLSLTSGLLQITATMGYSADVSITRRWSLIVRVPEFPILTVTAPDGSSADAPVGCGTTWAFEDGTGLVESCVEKRPARGLGLLTVRAGTPVRLEAPGWTITSWSGACGTLDVEVDPLDAFSVVNGCDLGGSLVPGPVVFLPRPDGQIVRLFVTLEMDGVTATGSVYASVAIIP